MVERDRKPSVGQTSALTIPQTLEAQSMAAVSACHIREGFVRPAYGGFCFSGIPGFIDAILTGRSDLQCLPTDILQAVGSYDHVIFVFFDAFGWESFERFREGSPFLKAFDSDGIVMKATSQFPSTTAAHATTAQSGQAAFEHQVCGWEYFEPKVGRMIKPLPFALCDKPSRDSLLELGFDPSAVLPRSLLVPHLVQNGVSVRWHGPKEFYPSTFGKHFLPAEDLCGFRSLADGVNAVRDTLTATPARSYQMLYCDDYDVVCHRAGVGANDSDRVALGMLRRLEGLLSWQDLPRTLLIVSADHGQMKDRKKGGIAINHVMPELEGLLKKDASGEPIYFSGGKRHLCLHPTPEAEAHVMSELRSKLAGVASVLSVGEMSAHGLLGPGAVTDEYLQRLGTVAVLPDAGRSVYWDKPPLFDYGDISNHGGVSPQEMEIPLLLLSLGGRS